MDCIGYLRVFRIAGQRKLRGAGGRAGAQEPHRSEEARQQHQREGGRRHRRHNQEFVQQKFVPNKQDLQPEPWPQLLVIHPD